MSCLFFHLDGYKCFIRKRGIKMKIIHTVKLTLVNIKKSFERFPLTILISTLLAVSLIYTIETSHGLDYIKRDNLTRLNMVVGLGIPMSMFINLLAERFSNKLKVIGHSLGGAFLILYYNFLLPDFGMVPMTRYVGTLILFVTVCFYALKIKKDENYEIFVMKVFSGLFVTILYAAVMYIGLAAILFTIENLFEVNFIDSIYIYIWLIVVFVFGVSLFLSKIPIKEDNFESYEYLMSLKILLLYIVVPLITVYTIILYIYFMKILVTWEWPKGLVSHLVLWYSSVSVGVIFLLTPIIEDNRVAKGFKFFFPKFILPILLMMFLSIGQRINQYGITEKRYYILVLGLWVFAVMLYFSIIKSSKNTIIPISLSIVVFLSIYGPISSYNLSKMSQNRRLENILEEKSMLVNGSIVANQDIDKDTKHEISNIIDYFYTYHELEDIIAFPDDYDLDDTKNLLGFEYSPLFRVTDNFSYFGYHVDIYDLAIDVRDFEYYMNISSWRDELISLDGLDIIMDQDSFILSISEDDDILISVDIRELAEEVHMKSIDKTQYKTIEEIDDMTVNIDNENIKIKIIFNNLNGVIDIDTDEVDLKSAEFILLIDRE